jgi:hypothetical protein
VTHACRPPRAVQRLRRHQQPAGALLPLQGGQAHCCWPWQGGTTAFAECRPAMGGARRAECAASWRLTAGCSWRTN